MNGSASTVLTSVIEVFGLVAIAWIYSRRLRPDVSGLLRVTMHIFIPCLAFTSILDARLRAAEFGLAAAATLVQIGAGLLVGALALRLTGRADRRELLLPIAFVNSANLPFPLLLANFGPEGLSRGILCYTVTNLAIFSIGVLLVHGRGGLRDAIKQPALWATVAAGLLRLAHVQPPEIVMRIPRLAGLAAVPVMLFILGEALSRTRIRAVRDALFVTGLRYATGALALAVTLAWLRPEGLLRKVLILYALLPSAVVNVAITEKAGRNGEAVASAVLLTTLIAVGLIPLLIATTF